MAEAVEQGADLWETTAAARIRQVPHPSSKVMATVRASTPLIILQTRGEWSEVLTENGHKGWLPTELIRKVSSGTLAPASTPEVQREDVPAAQPASSFSSPAPAVAPEKTLVPMLLKLEKDRFVTPIDFCSSSASTVAKRDRFVRQKLVLFRLAAAADAKMDGPGTEECEQHVAELFQAAFPMKRFDNIVSPSSAPPDLVGGVGQVGLAALEGNLRQSSPFVAYSIKCADYVAVPVLKSCSGELKTSKDKRGRTIKSYDATVEAELAIWRRQGNELHLHKTISSSAPTLANRASDIAQEAQASMARAADKIGGATKLLGLMDPLKAVELVSAISPMPSSTCMASGAAKPSEDPGCQVSINGTVLPFAQPVAEMRKCLMDPPEQPDDAWLIRCGLRNRAEQLALNLQKEARGVDGWRLWAAIKEDSGAPAISLGRDEGVYVGEVFHAVERLPDGSRVKHGFAKVISVGPGGEAGDFKATLLRWRAGGASGHDIFEEHPQLGLSVGLSGLASLLLVPPVLVDPSRNVYFRLGTVYGGMTLRVGYDLSGMLKWSELWAITNVGFLMAFGDAINTALLDIQVLAEKRLYLGRRLDWFFGIGPSMVQAILSLQNVAGFPKGTSAQAFTMGLAFETGLDLAVTADLYVRLGALWRQHFMKVEEFDTDEGTWRPSGSWDGEPFSTTFSGLVVNLGASWVF